MHAKNELNLMTGGSVRESEKIENSKKVYRNMTARKPKLSPADRVVHEQFTTFGRNAKEWSRKCALLLPEIEKRQIWKKRGCICIYEYAAKLAGMSRNSVDDALRILRKIEDKPALLGIVSARGLNAVRPILGIATAETADFWAEKAQKMSKNTLEVYVREFRRLSDGASDDMDATATDEDLIDKNWVGPEHGASEKFNRLNGRTSTPALSLNGKLSAEPYAGTTNRKISDGLSAGRKILTINLPIAIAEELEKLRGAGDWDSLMAELLELRRQKIEAMKPAADAVMAKVATTNVPTESGAKDGSTIASSPYALSRNPSRHIPAKIKRYVLAKTRGQCGFPGCVKPNKILHHTQRWVLRNSHDPNKIVPLCKAHERIAHSGLIANEDGSTKDWTVRARPVWWDFKNAVDKTVNEYRVPEAGTARQQ